MLLEEERNPRIGELEEQIHTIQVAYVEECKKLYEKKNFDPDLRKKDAKKLSEVAEKYVDIIAPLEEELDQLLIKEAEQKELERKRKYKDV